MPDFREEVRKRLARLNLEPTREASIVEEVALHMEDRYRDLLAQGSNAEQAQSTILAELDQDNRLTRGLRAIEPQAHLQAEPPGAPGFGSFAASLWKDGRYSVRALRLNAGFSIFAILSLALGIGANTAIFQLLDAVRLRALPVKNPGELAQIRIANMRSRTGHMEEHDELSNPLWEQIRDHQEAFTGVFAWGTATFNLATGGEMRLARGLWVSGDYFRVLGVQPVLGRLLTVNDDQHGCGLPAAVISYAFWQREYGGASSAVGSTLKIHNQQVEVVGVTPASFFGVDVGRSFDVAIPLCADPLIRGEATLFTRRDGWWLDAIGRLKPGWSLEKANSQLESISPGIFEATLPPTYNPEQVKKYRAAKLGASPGGSGLSALRQAYENPLWLLLALAGTVLLIACANLANLTLARASARERETAVRLALGASRFRLMQQVLMESLLLAVTGAIAGALLAQILTRALVSFLGTRSDQAFLDLTFDWRVLSFTAGLAVLTCLLFGLAPALRASGTSPVASMKAGGRGASADRKHFGVRRILVVTQVALSLMLVVGAFLFVRTFQNLLSLDPGFQVGGVLSAYVDIDPLQLPLQRRTPFKKELLERVRAIPGVESAAEASIVPLNNNWWNDTVLTSASAQPVRETAFFNNVSPGYFKTMKAELLHGRDVSNSDSIAAPAVAVVNETFVRKFLPGIDPLGKTFRLDLGPTKPQPVYQVIGVVRDTKYGSLRQPILPIAYLAAAQSKDPDTQPALLVRSNISMDAMQSSMARAIRDLNPAITFHFAVLQTEVRDSLMRERLMASLSGFFGFLAALLATIGLYGVISYMVVRRRSEIGIRMALGADRTRVLGLIMREAVKLLAVGLAVGTVLALAGAKAATSLLFGLKAHDPQTFILSISLLAIVSLAASALPAYRAARVDPLDALRNE
ncbi:MAG: ABC transporter permease [Candidatus Angelobacter sp.]